MDVGHVSGTARQEWLHKCLCKLKAPTETDVDAWAANRIGQLRWSGA